MTWYKPIQYKGQKYKSPSFLNEYQLNENKEATLAQNFWFLSLSSSSLGRDGKLSSPKLNQTTN